MTSELMEFAKLEDIRRTSHIRRVGGRNVVTNPRASEIGCIVECGLAHLTGLPWRGFNYVGDKHLRDVGPLEVRGTCHHRNPTLMIYERDQLWAPYVLGEWIESSGLVRFHGWRFGFECRESIYWVEPSPRPRWLSRGERGWWCVPYYELHTMSSLREWLRGGRFSSDYIWCGVCSVYLQGGGILTCPRCGLVMRRTS
jgi:hypothetical protein